MPETEEVVLPEIRHRLWLQMCFEPLEGLGQDEDLTLANADEHWRIAECERLFDRCTEQVSGGRHAEMREAFEILFGLLRRIDEGTDDILFFADEGGSWLVVVAWEKVLPAWFECLAPATGPEEYAEAVVGVIDEFDDFHRRKHLREARRVASPAQKKALEGA